MNVSASHVTNYWLWCVKRKPHRLAAIIPRSKQSNNLVKKIKSIIFGK